MLRVAFLDQSGDVIGGAERTLATFLRNRPPDIEPLVLVFGSGAFYDQLVRDGIPVRALEMSSNVKRSTRETFGVGSLLALATSAARISALLRRERVDVLYTNTMKANFLGALASRLAGVPCVMHFHDLPEGNALRALRIAARFGSQKRIACSKTVADWIGLRDTTAIYGPVDLAAYEDLPSRARARATLGLPQNVPIVGLIGRINRWKGHDRFVRIAARVNERTHAVFVIVGSALFRDADFECELKIEVARLGLDEIVYFIPWLADVREAYAAIDLNVNTSWREPFGRAVPEAAAAGVATVLFDDSGAAETVVDGMTGAIVPAGDEVLFADAILAAIGPNARAFDSATVRRAARCFDAQTIAAEMAEVIRATVL